MSTDLNGWIGAIVAGVVALAWLFQLKGRLDTHEAVCSERYKNVIERLDRLLGEEP